MPTWKFKPYEKDDMKENPIQGEFFTTNEVGNISNAVVREGIQNALDESAKDQDQPVKIRIFFSGDKYKISKSDYSHLFINLYKHLSDEESGIRDMPDFDKGMKFLVFEDFNTKGLEGNPEEVTNAETSDKSKPHNFFWFWRNVGRSGKSDEKLGRWGLGKTVFPAASRINTFFGLTKRKSDNSKLLMGQSILMSHNLDDDKVYGYKPYGYYGEFLDSSNKYFSSPIKDRDFINHFEKLFRLERKEKYGFSLIVPFVTDQLSYDGMIYSVLEQYFFPILNKKLEVSIQFEDKIAEINYASVMEVINHVDWSSMAENSENRIESKEAFNKLVQFTLWIINIKDLDLYKLNVPKEAASPQWRSALFNTLDISKLSEKFENGERIGFFVPLKYHPKNESPKICWFKAFLEKDTSLKKSESHYIRNNITITGIRSLKFPGVRGVALIEDDNLMKMIGDAENPAHTEIHADSRNFKDKYHDGDKCISFLTRTLNELYIKLQKPAEGIQTDFLKDIFYVPIESQESEKVEPDDDSGDDSKDDDPPIPPPAKPSSILLIKTKGGFRITKNPLAESLLGITISLKVAYIVARGNPLAKYDKLDFELNKSPIRTSMRGVTVNSTLLNELTFEINDDSFELEVSGFDVNRDLYIKTRELTNAEV